jgi:hypothetical protein
MKPGTIIILFFIATLFVFALSVQNVMDPRNAANADAIRWKAANEDAQANMERAQQDAEWQLKQSERKQLSDYWVSAWKVAIPWFVGIFSFCVCFVALSLALALILSVQDVRTAFRIYAINKASLVPVDPRTGQFPFYIPPGQNTLMEPNVGMTMLTNKARAPDKTLSIGANGVRLGGVTSRNTAASKNPDAVSSVQHIIDYNHPAFSDPDHDKEQS